MTGDIKSAEHMGVAPRAVKEIFDNLGAGYSAGAIFNEEMIDDCEEEKQERIDDD